MRHAATLLFCAIATGFIHTHTDEIPVVLGCVAALAAAGTSVCRTPWLPAALCTGSAVPLSELLVQGGILRAPWPAGHGFPFAALVAFAPAFAGAALAASARSSPSFRRHRQ